MVIVKGDGMEMLFNPSNGDVKITDECDARHTWAKENGYLDINSLEGYLGIDPHYLPTPPCKECPDYKDCLGELEDGEEPDNMYCTAIDDIATADTLIAAFAAMNDDERQEVYEVIGR